MYSIKDTKYDPTSKINLANYATVQHKHEISEVDNLQETLDSKAEKEHEHDNYVDKSYVDEEFKTKADEYLEEQRYSTTTETDITSSEGSNFCKYSLNEDGSLYMELTYAVLPRTTYSCKVEYKDSSCRIYSEKDEENKIQQKTEQVGESVLFSGFYAGFYPSFTVKNFIKNDSNTITLNYQQSTLTYTQTLTVTPYDVKEEKYLTKQAVIDLFYPVGSIYTSMNSTNPSEIFGGTWEQITERFLYCADSSKETGGSKKITTENLPAHSHTANWDQSVYDLWHERSGTVKTNIDVNYETTTSDLYHDHSLYEPKSIATSTTGSGTDYLPPYITVYCWYRTA